MPIAEFNVKDTTAATKKRHAKSREIKKRFDLPTNDKSRARARLQQDVWSVVQVARDTPDTERSAQMILDLIERETAARVELALRTRRKETAVAKAKTNDKPS